MDIIQCILYYLCLYRPVFEVDWVVTGEVVVKNDKIGPVDLSKNKNGWVGLKVIIKQMDPCWFHVNGYDVIFELVLQLWRHK